MSSAYSTKSAHKAQNIFCSIDRRRLVLWAILFAAMVGFELFNFSTTQVALRDLLGDLSMMGVSWATILTFAFCGIDFGGIARIFIPEEHPTRSNETWYLFGAWLLAGTMNATLTWWGISLALVDRSLKSSAFINPDTLTEGVPVFLALLVWVTRILLIGGFAIAGPHLLSKVTQPNGSHKIITQPSRPVNIPRPARSPAVPAQAANLPRPRPVRSEELNRPEPEYVPEPGYAPAQTPYQTLGGKSEPGRPNASPQRF